MYSVPNHRLCIEKQRPPSGEPRGINQRFRLPDAGQNKKGSDWNQGSIRKVALNFTLVVSHMLDEIIYDLRLPSPNLDVDSFCLVSASLHRPGK